MSDRRPATIDSDWRQSLLALVLAWIVFAGLVALCGCQRLANHPESPETSAPTMIRTTDATRRALAYSAVREILMSQRGGAPMTCVCLLDDGVRCTIYGEWGTTRIEATADAAGCWRVTRQVNPVEGVEVAWYYPWTVERHDALVAAVDARLLEVCCR